jgi:capsular exopolysaccharide synthesis family protein
MTPVTMPDDNLIHPPPIDAGSSTLPAVESAAPLPDASTDGAYLPPLDHLEQDEPSADLGRYFFAVMRYKWMLALAIVVGSGGAYLAWTSTEVQYTAEGNLWIQVDDGQNRGDVGPVRTSGLLESNAWIELLRSYQVLDTVAVQQRLLLNVPDQFAPAFERFELQEPFLPGAYELLVGQTGDDFVLRTDDGVLVQQGGFGVPIGENVGFDWTPTRGSFAPDVSVPFTIVTARDAAQQLDRQLVTGMDRAGNFLSLSLSGTDPEKIASILNAVMERHVSIAASIKSRNLDEKLTILVEQLDLMQAELDQAELDLEEFRITTISLPTDDSGPIAGGLELTRDPVFGSFFNMKVEVEELRRDRARLQAIVDDFGTAPIRIEALEVIGAAAQSSELRRILDELVDLRSEIRVLRDGYTDDYPPIQDLLTQIESLEEGAIPRVVTGILEDLTTRQAEMQRYVDAAAADLAEIPPRTIEEGRLRRGVMITENLYNDIRGRVESARLAAASSIPDLRILDRASPPRRPTQDQRLPMAAMVFFGCLGVAMAGAILLDRIDSRFRYAADVGRDIGLDILGSIPRIESGKGRRGVLNAAQALEAFRELRIHVGFAYGSAGPITVTITSPSEGEGKSLIASNLAVAFSEVGRRTLLIDGDTRRGDAHRLIGRERSPGLIDYLRERSGEDIIQATDHPNLDFIGSGSRGVSTPELLASPRMAYFVGTLKRTYDVIIVDAPPLASGGDPLILGSLTGNLAIVIRTGTTEKALAHAKLDRLSRLPIRILGAILNDVTAADSHHAYYSSYLASYEPIPEDDDADGTQLLSGAVPEV